MYQFPMIAVDLYILTLLKAFALVRSKIRYYTFGLSSRKKWSQSVLRLNNFGQFRDLEIEEPTIIAPAVEVQRGVTFMTKIRLRYQRLFRKTTPKDIMSRSKSCVQLQHGQIDTSLHHSASSLSLAAGGLGMPEEEQLRKDVEKELGSKGVMLLTTTSRLREARLQASSKTLRVARMLQANDLPGAAVNNLGLLKVRPISEYNNQMGGDESVDISISDDTENDENTVVEPLAVVAFLLTGIVKRNHLSVEDMLIDDAQTVMEFGRHRISAKARNVIMGYHREVAECLEWIAEFKSNTSLTAPSPSSTKMPHYSLKVDDLEHRISSYQDPNSELLDRINLLRRMKHNMGRSALMLSGGGAQAMYHGGTIKALCESGLYKDIHVISGTSGGSIVAAMCAMRTQEELLRDVCVSHVATDYCLTGQMKRENIRWFPTFYEMVTYWLKHRLLVDSKEFKRCCDFYYSDVTFEEAFKMTGKNVCITVSASRAEDQSKGAQRLLLNHISTPHVTLSSAVAASCALPGVMAPSKLVTKNSVGTKEPFEVDGVEWIDGSVQADLPFKRISTLFNVSNYIVCQTNFHVLPFLRKAHHPNSNSLYWRIFQTCEWDMRNRALNLSRFGLFPKIFGQDISKVFKQKYHGNLTLVPRFTTMQTFGLNALSNPSVKDMENYLQNGQAAAWPYLSVIKEMLRLETSIDNCISRLTERIQQASINLQHINSDLMSDASASYTSRAFMFSSHRETELLKEKVKTLEVDNLKLKRKIEQMNRAVAVKMKLSSNAPSRSPAATEIEFVSYCHDKGIDEEMKEK